MSDAENKSVVRGHGRRTIPLAEALAETLRHAGPVLFTRLVRERAERMPPAREAARSLIASARRRVGALVEEVRRRGLREATEAGLRRATLVPLRVAGNLREVSDYYAKLPAPRDKAEYLLSWALYVFSFLGGFIVGLQTPQVDLKMKREGAPGDRIVLHAFPLVAVELTFDWLREILRQVRDGVALSPEDHRRVESLVRIADNLRAGLDSGASAHRNLARLPLPGGQDIEVSLQTQAFTHAERLFRSLTQGGPR